MSNPNELAAAEAAFESALAESVRAADLVSRVWTERAFTWRETAAALNAEAAHVRAAEALAALDRARAENPRS
jgi:hypothetical protein